jgi:NADH:ubiquinone oxidoreductase subunit D
MHAAFFRPGGVAKDLSPLLIEKIYKFVDNFASRIDEIETLLTDNVI